MIHQLPPGICLPIKPRFPGRVDQPHSPTPHPAPFLDRLCNSKAQFIQIETGSREPARGSSTPSRLQSPLPPHPPRGLILTEKMKASSITHPFTQKAMPLPLSLSPSLQCQRRGIFLLSKAIKCSQLSPRRLASAIIAQVCLHLFLLHWLLLLGKDAQVSPSRIICLSVCLASCTRTHPACPSTHGPLSGNTCPPSRLLLLRDRATPLLRLF